MLRRVDNREAVSLGQSLVSSLSLSGEAEGKHLQDTGTCWHVDGVACDVECGRDDNGGLDSARRAHERAAALRLRTASQTIFDEQSSC